MKYTEVERKFALPNPDAMRDRLTELGAPATGTSRQIDVYYNHPSRDFLEGDVVSEWLRVRLDESEAGASVASINFKRWLPLGAAEATHADEYESVIADPQAVSRLLDALGFTEMVKVDKQRERRRLDTPSGTVEVALDEVEDLGGFAEFEYIGDGDLDQAGQAITDAVKAVTTGGVSLGERDRRGYPYLLLDRER
ncbi:class IV adenylate cyclase [Actinomadura algeriensis]|uniref:Adenylate cyclase class 2 n=1 Tax=Actinomadura algeriensis TaxID=1679523 RepID=A0ABR9JIL8_9ACTN|nr:CYTH domain-containing protein [Actinomadura algeriensis]MBE1530368.1 adenylate cyclase class 2 [Actinomadura algeriensis]